MKVLCVGSRGTDLPDEMRQRSGNQPGARFPIEVGTLYTVRAMGLWDYDMVVMVVSEYGWPNWFPIELFVVMDHEVPATWEFSMQVNGFRALWGYPTLIRDPKHNENLSDRRKKARETFLKESGVIGFDAVTKRFLE